MTQEELDQIISEAPEYRKGIEEQLIKNQQPDQALEYHSIALAYPWKNLDTPDHHPRDGNESHIPFIHYALFNKRMDELGYTYIETKDLKLFDRRFVFNRKAA